jgi:antitoxin (DNA-binding transcriptional repressor) of toxin-antitoxin stability system
MCVMKTATVREVQHHLAKVLRWVEQGQTVEITRRRQIIAKLVPARTTPAPVSWPDRVAELRAIYGPDPVPGKPASEIISDDRDRDL